MKQKKNKIQSPPEQLELLDSRPSVVHFWDSDEALRTGRLVRKIKKGKKTGTYVVADSSGKKRIPAKIRNIE
jgi:predicted transposase YbfD/YdcC